MKWGRVLHTLKNPLLAKGYCVLRYNSRGVGKSSGWPSFTGLQEAEDLRELVQWALDEIPGLDTVVVLVRCFSELSLTYRVTIIYRGILMVH